MELIILTTLPPVQKKNVGEHYLLPGRIKKVVGHYIHIKIKHDFHIVMFVDSNI